MRMLGCLVITLLVSTLGILRGDESSDELKKLEGKWTVEKDTLSGEENDRNKEAEIHFQDGKMTMAHPKQGKGIFEFRIDSTKKPKELDFTGPLEVILKDGGKATKLPKSETMKAIYDLEGDKLTICWSFVDLQRPMKFEDKDRRLIVLKRKK